jgi:alkaline phosphatase D
LCDGGYENFRKFKAEYDDFMAFLEKENIKGVVFFSGDVHYAEISKLQRKDTYPLYDFTFSAFTSFSHKGKPNLNAVADSRFTKNNYGLVTITGKKGQRICRFECKSRDGKPVWEYNISEEMLR